MIKPRWDIFCKIVDNFGDIGVCWRLSQQLRHEHHLAVRLFIDDLNVAKRIIPQLDHTQPTQVINGVEIAAWPTTETTLPEVVIESFSCELPACYVQQICAQPPAEPTIWINLEYLSAENWVADFHAKPSKHPSMAYTKHFFFPGFVEATGGLLRERTLIETRDAFLNDADQTMNFWRKHFAADHIASIQSSIKISLFCYAEANSQALIEALSTSPQPTSLFLPFNSDLTAINTIIADYKLTLGTPKQIGNLHIHYLPFLSQMEYDQLLWACDLNFVRGEDSWIRAIWAGKPFIWQPYIQDKNAHIQKLNAFLTHYTKDAPQSIQSLIIDAHLAWSNASTLPAAECWPDLIAALPALQCYALQQSEQQAAQTDLGTKLVRYSENLSKNTV